jgi:hypothetical protein
MVRGIIQVEISIESQILRYLKDALEGLEDATHRNLEMQQAWVSTTVRDISAAIPRIEYLQNLEYREGASQEWKRWAGGQIVTILKESGEALKLSKKALKIIKSGKTANKSISNAIKALKEVIPIIERMIRYELRIGDKFLK